MSHKAGKAPRANRREQTDDSSMETMELRYGEKGAPNQGGTCKTSTMADQQDGVDGNGNTVGSSQAEIAEITADYLQRYREFKQIERRKCKYSVSEGTREVRYSKENNPMESGGQDKDQRSYPEVRPLLDLINEQQTQRNGHTAVYSHVENGATNERIITDTQPRQDQEMQMPEQEGTGEGNWEFPLVKPIAEWTGKENQRRKNADPPHTADGRHQRDR